MHILLMYSPHAPSRRHLQRLRAADAGVRLTVAESEDEAIAAAAHADAIFGHRYLRQCVLHAPKLRWVQSTTNGVDRLPCAALEERGVTLTRFTGSAATVGRHAAALALSLTRGLHEARDHQQARRWDKDLAVLPPPERALVFGAGRVGRAIARAIRGMVEEIAGVRRSAAEAAADDDFDRFYDRHAWRDALEGADWCFLALPHTAETAGIIDEAALRRLPRHAALVNVGRGETLDVDALAAALREGHLGGAALDVLPAGLEPLPSSHALWDVPRLLITPHVAAYSPARSQQVEAFIEAQLRRFLAQEPLREVVLP